jgi:hypothetical protein
MGTKAEQAIIHLPGEFVVTALIFLGPVEGFKQ